jgi:hypothetical protein
VDSVEVKVHGTTVPGTTELDARHPARIAIHCDVYTDVDRINMAVFIIRSDGVSCCMVRTKLERFDLSLVRGRRVVTLDLDPLQLVSGTYCADVELTNETDSMVLKNAATRSPWFAVRGRARSYDAHSGVFEPAAKWGYAPAEAAGNEPVAMAGVTTRQ